MREYQVTIKSNDARKTPGIKGLALSVPAANFQQALAKIENKYNLDDYRIICIREKGAKL